ncbi:MAG: TMEM175 family protein [Caldilineaceae bacterium]
MPAIRRSVASFLTRASQSPTENDRPPNGAAIVRALTLGRSSSTWSTALKSSALTPSFTETIFVKTKNLSQERLVFFSDAIVAIAITLLALELKVERIAEEHITFEHIFAEWPLFLAFLLSFFLIALFWVNHHKLFQIIENVDGRLLWINMGWLLFIVLIPFTTSLVSSDFGQKTTALIYSINILGVTFFQNLILDYATGKFEFFFRESQKLITHELDEETKNIIADQQRYCNIVLANSLIAVAVSFFFPNIAFGILFTRPIMKRVADWYLAGRSKNQK